MAPPSEPADARRDAMAEDDRARGDWDHCVRREIPAALLGREVLTRTADFSLWLEDVRGYSRGFTFTVRLVVSKEVLKRFDLPFGPTFLGRFPDREGVDFWVSAGGRRYSNERYSNETRRPNGRDLQVIAGGAVPQVTWTQWWVADVSMPEIQIGFDWASIGVGGSRTIGTGNWQETIANNVLLLPISAP
ncbi:hypothetical protein SAMN05216368_12129 [Cryobacterium flavum]|uniref:Uncharacterized protein n=2 Tax=Cryobacterium flavum TaxID=1424659 RepID=A0A5E9G576_9MICO|nr:hypothetical protein [Cryobacterium flavum]SDO52431.1 hypothetical protein SAMN05216368_12129 [Cryobacterium flavum]